MRWIWLIAIVAFVYSQKDTTVLAPVVIEAQEHLSGKQLTPSMLRTMQPISAEEALMQLPGVQFVGDFGLSNRLNVGFRGAYPRRSEQITLLMDGIPIAPAPYLAPEAYYNPPIEIMQKVVCYKNGVELLEYGPQTTYGVLHYQTPPISNKPRTQISIHLGQNNYQRYHIRHSHAKEQYGVFFQGLYRRFNGFMENNFQEIGLFHAKAFWQIQENQRLELAYLLYGERSQASYSGLTPFVFQYQPKANPFDQDWFRARRYALKLHYAWNISPKLQWHITGYSYDFNRLWSRQEATVIPIAQAANYLGYRIQQPRYQFLKDLPQELGYVRVGVVEQGKEPSSSRNRYFQVLGIYQKLRWQWHKQHFIKAKIGYHKEQFRKEKLYNPNARIAYTGTFQANKFYTLDAIYGFIASVLSFQRLQITPALRTEWATFAQQDLLKQSQDTTLNPYKERKHYWIVLPGIFIRYRWLERSATLLESRLSIHRGYVPPTTSFGFLIPDTTWRLATNEAFDAPQRSWNIDWTFYHRWGVWQQEIAFFGKQLKNYYAAGYKERFIDPAVAYLYGIEITEQWDWQIQPQWRMQWWISATWIRSFIHEGILEDRLFFNAIFSDEQKQQVLERIYNNPQAYQIYIGDSLVTQPTLQAWEQYTTLRIDFQRLNRRLALPYVPSYQIHLAWSVQYKRWQWRLQFTLIGQQYTEFFNLEQETLDGAMGALPAYHFWNFAIRYLLPLKRYSIAFDFSIKNITNEIYRASRLHRAISGIVPGGFRFIYGGITWYWN